VTASKPLDALQASLSDHSVVANGKLPVSSAPRCVCISLSVCVFGRADHTIQARGPHTSNVDDQHRCTMPPLRVFTRSCTHTNTHTHTRIHAHTHTHTYIHMHARICIQYAHAYYLQYSAQPWTPPPPSPRGGTQAPLDQQTPLHVYGISLLSGHMSRASYPYNHPSSNGGTQPPLQLHIPQADARPLSSSTWSPPTPSAASDRGERASERARGRERGSEGARGREG